MKSTTDYDIFKFRDDNRAAISRRHVVALMESIKQNNQLEKYPIKVNQNMEIINGQHRIHAARELGVPIYYEVEESFTPEDLYISNLSIQWTLMDYFNFYLKHEKKEYIALKKFIEDTGCPLAQSLQICSNDRAHITTKKFKSGAYIFTLNIPQELVLLVRETISTLKNVHNVAGKYTSTCKFWLACIFLFQQEEFNIERWRQAINLYGYRIGPRTTKSEFIQMLANIYNYKLHASPKLYTGSRD